MSSRLDTKGGMDHSFEFETRPQGRPSMFLSPSNQSFNPVSYSVVAVGAAALVLHDPVFVPKGTSTHLYAIIRFC